MWSPFVVLALAASPAGAAEVVVTLPEGWSPSDLRGPHIGFSEGGSTHTRHLQVDAEGLAHLDRLGLEQISGLKCPDGMGHEFTIDRLLLRHDGITLLMTRQYPGRIFCAEKIDQWTQMLGQKSYRFKNPLYELDHQLRAIAECVGDVPVDGYLFFDAQSDFPKGHPERVIHPDKIPTSINRNNRHQVEMPVMDAWRMLKDKVQS